jgi:hypothetical protein
LQQQENAISQYSQFIATNSLIVPSKVSDALALAAIAAVSAAIGLMIGFGF